MTGNKSSEVDLLRRVASAAEWVIRSNGDDPVGRDGRARVGINWVMANGELNKALRSLREQYGIEDHHVDQKAQAVDYARPVPPPAIVAENKDG